MKVLLTGGGTGGHITPILAVAHELKLLTKGDCTTIYVGERGSKYTELTQKHSAIDETHQISAGKFRRYHGESWLRRLTDVKTMALNIRDVFRVGAGTLQAWKILGHLKPDVVFLKGGFVGVPIGLAAIVRRVPIVTHDSDALAGLANRLVGRWASLHATALPAEYYNYPIQKTCMVGVLVEHNFQPVTQAMQLAYKKQLGVPVNAKLLLVTGGSSGAERINQAVVQIIDEMLKKVPDLRVIHQVGKGKLDVYKGYKHDRLQILEFLNPMYVYTGAADLVVTRASANTLAELGVQGRAGITIPSSRLANGHQLKNAERLKKEGAALVILEEDLYDQHRGLQSALMDLLQDERKRLALGKRLQSITTTDAAHKLAELIIDRVENN